MSAFRLAAVEASAISSSRKANHSTSGCSDLVPGRVADDGVKAAGGIGVLPVAPDAGEGDLPVQEVFAVGYLSGLVPDFIKAGPEGALADGVGDVDAVGAVRQEREGLFRADGDCADERLFEDGAGLLFHGRR